PGLKQTMHAMHEHLGLPASLAFLTVGAEFFGGIGLIAGLLSRIAAFGIIVIMLAAIVMVHGRYGLFLDWFGDRKGHGYKYHLLAIALAAAIVVKSPGAASLDRLFVYRDRGLTTRAAPCIGPVPCLTVCSPQIR